MERIRLDIIPKGLMPVCHASQYDAGRVIRLDLMDGLQGYSLTNEEIELRVRKPDNNIVTTDVDFTTGSSFVDIVTTEQMCACEGDNLCELKLSKDGNVIHSLNFIMRVEIDPLKDGIESETEIHNLETQIRDINEEMLPDMVAEEVTRQYDSENVIFDDVPTENHGDGYTVNSAGLKAYIPKAIDELDDVNISSPTSNQALVWDADNNKWTNGEVSTVGNLDDLSDVDTTGKATGDSLRYDGNEWIAQPTTIALTQAEYNTIVDFTPYANTHIIITDAPNLNPTASDIEYSSGVTVKQAIDSKIQIATFDFSKSINATTQATYYINRYDFNLPNNAVCISVFLRENLANSVNAGGLVYSAYVNPTATKAVEGAIYNGTNANRTYPITATLFYKTT